MRLAQLVACGKYRDTYAAANFNSRYASGSHDCNVAGIDQHVRPDNNGAGGHIVSR